jgi:hypothetical protein
MALTPEQITQINNTLLTKLNGGEFLKDLNNLEKVVQIRNAWLGQAGGEYTYAIVPDNMIDSLTPERKAFYDEAAKNANIIVDRYITSMIAAGRQKEITKATDETTFNSIVDSVANSVSDNALAAAQTIDTMVFSGLLGLNKKPEKTPEQKAQQAKENRLSEQAALMLSIDTILQSIVQGGTTNVSSEQNQVTQLNRIYKNFAIIRYEDDRQNPTGHFFLTNKFTKTKGVDKLFEQLPPQLISLLVPSIKLYKTFYPVPPASVAYAPTNNVKGYDWRIPFDDVPVSYKDETSEFVAQDINKILDGHGSFHGVGIKSFSYHYKGVNPAEINTNIEATLDLFFQNPEELVKEIDINFKDPRFKTQPSSNNGFDNVKFSYLDLINGSSRTINDVYGPRFNNEYYKIKIECGYTDINIEMFKELLRNSSKSDYSKFNEKEIEDIINAINGSKVKFNLTPYNYDINFNKDGTINLKINFAASIDTLLASPEADLFSITKDTKTLNKFVKKFNDFLDLKQQNKINENNEQASCKSVDELKKDLQEFKQTYGTEFAYLKEEDLEKQLNLARKYVYNGLFNYLVGKEILEGDNSQSIKPKIYVALFKPDILGVKNSDNQNSTEKRILALKDGQQLLGVEPLFDDKQISTLVQESSEQQTTSSSSQPQELADVALQTLDERISVRFPDPNTEFYKVKFILLGDILDVALECLNNISPASDCPRIIFGGIPMAIPTEIVESFGSNVVAKLQEIHPNLADIPISFDMFQEFMIEHIVRPKKERYPIIQFIKDIISDLIIPAISPVVFGQSSAINASIRFSSAYFTLDAPNGKDLIFRKLEKDKKAYPKEITDRTYPAIINDSTLQDIKKYFDEGGHKVNPTKSTSVTSNEKNVSEDINYMFITCTSRFPNIYKGNEVDDKSKGVMHIRMGTDSGIVKEINFSKSPTPYLREMVARREGNGKGTSIKQVYNATVEMFGNNIFRPGDYIYIHPLFTFGSTGKALDLEQSLGVGGYYLVIDVKTDISDLSFKTSLKCSFQAHVEKESKENVKVKVVGINETCATK